MRRPAAVAFAIVLAACGGAPPTSPVPGAAPAPVASSFDGVWQFEYRVEECVGERHCGTTIGSTRKFNARVLSAAGAAVGVVSMGGDNIDVTGTAASDGSLVLRGVREPAIPQDHAIEVSRLQLRRSESGLTGSIEHIVTAPAAIEWPFRTVRVGGTITTVTRVADLPPAGAAGFAGRWVGRVVPRDCTPVGTQYCSALEMREVGDFILTLTESSGRVIGQFERHPVANVSGTSSGSTLTLEGTTEVVGPGYTRTTTVRSSTFTRDALGRLRGTMSLEVRTIYTDGRVISNDYRMIEFLNGLQTLPS